MGEVPKPVRDYSIQTMQQAQTSCGAEVLTAYDAVCLEVKNLTPLLLAQCGLRGGCERVRDTPKPCHCSPAHLSDCHAVKHACLRLVQQAQLFDSCYAEYVRKM